MASLTVPVIRTVCAAGKTVVFDTGRAVCELEEQIALLPEVRYAVFASGAGLYDIQEKKTFSLCGIPSALTERIFALTRTKDCMPQIVIPDADVIQASHMEHLEHYHTLDNLHEKVVIQLNDTHPIMIIPELMRILMDEYNYGWDQAWYIVTHTVAYTNHTIMHEALERWPVSVMVKLLPRIYILIQEIDRRFRNEVINRTNDYNLCERVAIIRDNQVHMAHMGAACCFSVNGVARIHTEILKNDVMRDFYQIFPEKFNSKTNGVTHRRWLVYSNPQLTKVITDTIGDGFIDNLDELEKLKAHIDDPILQVRFAEAKMARKKILAKYVYDTLGIEVNVNSIFDVQAKRLHAYKRQMLNCMHLIYLYQYIKEHPEALKITSGLTRKGSSTA